MRLDHVQLAAPQGCETAARRFYRSLLGLTEIAKPDVLRTRGGAWFELDGGQVHLGADPDFAPARKAHPALALPTADALKELAGRLEAAGCEVRWDAELPGARRFYVNDPFGNRLELLAWR
jgi:catechol 2,3-dioxygenase-like lactoylglutathione lyase family enzyme